MKFKEEKRKKKSCSGVLCQWVHQYILGLGHDRVQHHNWKKNSAYCYQAVGSCCFPLVWSNDRAPTGWLRSLSETSQALFSRISRLAGRALWLHNHQLWCKGRSRSARLCRGLTCLCKSSTLKDQLNCNVKEHTEISSSGASLGSLLHIPTLIPSSLWDQHKSYRDNMYWTRWKII